MDSVFNTYIYSKYMYIYTHSVFNIYRYIHIYSLSPRATWSDIFQTIKQQRMKTAVRSHSDS